MERRRIAMMLGIGAGTAAAAVFAVAGFQHVRSVLADPVGAVPPEGFETMRARAAYGSSSSCAPCHPDHLASWRRTFHRSMTQNPAGETIRAPFDGRAIEALGVRATPRREGDRFVIDLREISTGSGRAHVVARV